MKKYDVIIIGAGPSGIFCACRLKELDPDIEILMIEKGRSIEDRSCPKRVTKECVGCRPCSITTGFAGAGAFSDGKLSLSPDVGGTLPEILGYDRTQELIRVFTRFTQGFSSICWTLVWRFYSALWSGISWWRTAGPWAL